MGVLVRCPGQAEDISAFSLLTGECAEPFLVQGTSKEGPNSYSSSWRNIYYLHPKEIKPFPKSCSSQKMALCREQCHQLQNTSPAPAVHVTHHVRATHRPSHAPSHTATRLIPPLEASGRTRGASAAHHCPASAPGRRAGRRAAQKLLQLEMGGWKWSRLFVRQTLEINRGRRNP